MGRLFLEHMGGTRIFSCANCETYLTNRAQLLSTRFTGATGRAFLFHRVVNLDQSDALERIMLTGKHMLLRRNDVGRVTLEWLTAAMASHLSRHWSAARSQDSTRLKAGTYATVSRDLVAQVPGELDLSGGECVLVLEPSVEDVWARVRVLNDASRMGLCPTTYLEPYGQAMAETSVEAKAAHVLYDFSATDDGVLPLQAGSIVFVTSDLGDGWLQGYDSSGHHGMFPANYISYSDGHSIEPLHTDAYHSHVNSGEIAAMGDSAHSYDTAATASSSSNFEPDRSHVASSEDVRMVLYDFNTGVPGDLQISAGEKVAILSWLSDEWAVAQSLSHLEQVGNIPITFISKENELESAVAHEIGAGQEVSSTAVSNSDHWSALSDIDLMMLENLNSAGSMPARHSVPSFQSDDPFSVFSEPASSAMHETTQSSAPMRPPPPPVAKSFTLPASENDGQPVNNAPPAVQRQSGGGMAVEKWGEHRRRVLNELIITEKGFARCMCACIDALTACALERWSKHVDCAALKDGLDKVLELSNRLLPKLEAEQWKGDDRQSIGGAFLQLSTDFHKIYSEFWPKNDKATELLTKYASDSTCRNVLSNILASIQREDPACVDLNTAVCRPVARMLKYPLFIHELLKVTPPSHADHVALAEAHAMLTDVAKDVNEMKRRKFLVVKYRKAESAKIGDRLSKLNMHSVKKKGSRFGVRLSSTIGLTHLRHDAQFETLSHDYQKSRQSAAQFQKDVRAHCDRAHHVACRRRALAENWATLVADDTAQRGRGLAFREAWRKIAEECLPVYFAQVQKWVRGPLDSMLKTFDGPDKLIVKRNDKLLDYESISSKTKSGPDAHRLLEQQRLCEAEFAALNAQLIEDLPIMIDVISIVTAGTIGRLLRAQRDYSQTVWEVLKPFAPTNVRMGGSDASDDLSGQVIVIEDCFASERAALVKLIKLGSLNSLEKRMHSFLHPKVKGKKDKTVIRQSQDSLHRLSDDEQSVSGLEKSGSVRSSWRAFVQSRESKKTKQAPSTPSPRFPTLTQSPADQFSLVTKYSPADLYRVTASCLPLAGTESSGCDLSVRVGDVCAAVVRKDPMGEPDRWYVDIGIDKGFVPSRVLQLLTEHDRSEILHRGQNMQNGSAGSHAPLPVSAPVVMRPPQPAMKQPSNPLIDLSPTAETARSSTQQNLLDLDWSWSIGRQVGESQFFRESDRGTAEESTMQQQSKRFSQPAVFSQAQPSAPSRAAPPPPPQPTSATQNRRSAPLPPTTTGVTSPALQPVRAAPPPPPPPVQHRQSAPAAGAAQGQGLDFYVSDFEFDADSYGSPGCISLAERQVVCVIKKCDLDGNDEWWLVKDEHGNSGYVPYGFLRKLDSVQ